MKEDGNGDVNTVVYDAKIRIIKQITTLRCEVKQKLLLLFMMQRYE